MTLWVLLMSIFLFCLVPTEGALCDGGFEDYPQTTCWKSTKNHNLLLFDNSVPLQGVYHASFGGLSNATENLAQNITVTASPVPTFLQFYIAAVLYDNTDNCKILIDGGVKFQVNATAGDKYSYYAAESFDITAYADGLSHKLEIACQTFAGTSNSIFYFDEFSIINRPAVLKESDVYVAKSGSDITGDGTVGNPYASIQMGVWAIADGYTVQVSSGTFQEVVDTGGKEITIEGGPSTIINGTIKCNTVSGNLLLDGIIFAFAVKPPVSVGIYGGVLIKQCYFFNNFATVGAAIYVHDYGSVKCLGCIFELNSAYYAGIIYGGAYSYVYLDSCSETSTETQQGFAIESSGTVRINNSNFTDNAGAGLVSAIFLFANHSSFSNSIGNIFNVISGGFLIENSNFKGYLAVDPLFRFDDTLVNSSISNCNFIQNTVYASALIANDNSKSTVTLSRSNFISNTVDVAYSLLRVKASNVHLLQSSFFDNDAICMVSLYGNVTVDSTSFEKQPKGRPYAFHVLFFAVSNAKVSNCEFIDISTAIYGLGGHVSVDTTTFTSVETVASAENGVLNMSDVIVDSPEAIAFFYTNTTIYLQNATITNSPHNIIIASTSHLYIFSSTFRDITLQKEWAILVMDGYMTMYDTVFTQMSVPIVMQLSYSHFKFSNVSVIECQAQPLILFSCIGSMDTFVVRDTNALYFEDSMADISNSVFENIFDDIGGSILLNSCVFNFNSTTFKNNPTETMYLDRSIVSMDNCTFYENAAQRGTSSILSILRSEVFLSFCNFIGNVADRATIYVSFTSTLDARYCKFVNNVALSYEGAVGVDGEANFTNCDFEGNFSPFVGAGITFNLLSQGKITSCTFTRNSAMEGNALYFGSFSTVQVNNSLFSKNNSPTSRTIYAEAPLDIRFYNTEFKNCLSQARGSVAGFKDAPSIVFSNCTIHNNTAAEGVITLDHSTASFVNSTFQDNFVYTSGGIFSSMASSLFINSSKFVNSAVGLQQGTKNFAVGGVFKLVNSTMQAVNSVFIGNSATKGGVIHSEASLSNFRNCEFITNRASAGAVSYAEALSDLPLFDSKCSFTNNSAVYADTTGSNVNSHRTYAPAAIPAGDQFNLTLDFLDFYNSTVEVASVLLNVTVFRNDVFDSSFNLFGDLGYVSQFVKLLGDVGTKFTLTFQATITDTISKVTKTENSTHQLVLGGCKPGYTLALNRSQTTQSVCIPCRAGTVQWGKECMACPEGGVCPGRNELYPKAGYWVPPLEVSNSSVRSSAKLYTCDPYVCEYKKCREHNTGVLCGECEAGYSKMRIFCEKCTGRDAAKIFFYVLFCFSLGFILSCLPLPSASSFTSLIFYTNIISVFGQYNQYFLLIPLMQLNVDYWPWGCFAPLTFERKFYVSFACAFGVLFISISALGTRILSRRGYSLQELKGANILHRLISNVYTLIPIFLFFAFHMLTYIHIDGLGKYMSVDQMIPYTSTNGAFVLSILVILFTAAFVLLLVILFAVNRDLLQPLIAHYDDKFKFWDLVVLLRYILLALVYNCLPFDPQARTIVGVIVCVVMTATQFYLVPYATHSRNMRESVLLVLLTACALLINSHLITDSPVAVGTLLTIFGFLGFLVIILFNRVYAIFVPDASAKPRKKTITKEDNAL